MKQPIFFTKMHALGNDFVIINTIDQSFDQHLLPIKTLANRRLGIGFDQLLLLENANQADIFCRIYNADGSEVEQCGNGLRCVSRYLLEEKIISKPIFNLQTKAGIFPVHITDYDHIRVSFDSPRIQQKLITLNLKQTSVSLSILSLGNPHAIVKVNSLDFDAQSLAKEIATQRLFPNGVNVGFMQVIDTHHIRLRTIERGSGETSACGSNACAAVCAGILNNWLQSHARVEYPYGSLAIAWEKNDQAVHMAGPATRVFSGNLHLPLSLK